MIIFLTLLEITLIIGRIIAGYYAEAVPFLGSLCLPLTLICVGVGVFWFVFVCIEIYNKLKGKK